MHEKILIVEDEPIVGLDIQQELELLKYRVVGIAESAEEALLLAEEHRPDMVMMDMMIVGDMDGIQTALLLYERFSTPVIFLTSYSDPETINRAAEALPYGYLTKPFDSRELRATLRVALHKAKRDREVRESQIQLATSMAGMREGILLVTPLGVIHYMNGSAVTLLGISSDQVLGKQLTDIVQIGKHAQPEQANRQLLAEGEDLREELNCSLAQQDGSSVLVDLCINRLTDQEGRTTGLVVVLRDAGQRLRLEAMEESQDQHASPFDLAPMGMVQLDAAGRIVRVNDALCKEVGIQAETILGKTLTGLSHDADPRIAQQLLHKLIEGQTCVLPSRASLAH